MDIKQYRLALLSTLAAIIFCLPFFCLASDEGKGQIPLEDVQRFSTVIGEIKQYYVKPIADKELFDNAIRGMLSGLDPHSAYLDEDSFKELETSTRGEFAGLGLEVTLEDGVVKVISPLSGTVADRAGVKSGDFIIKLGSRTVHGMSLKEAVDLMRGKKGSTIVLTILRKGQTKPLILSLKRENIVIKSVSSRLIDNVYGYVRLTQFQVKTSSNMMQAIKKLNQQAGGKVAGLILDLRNNPGGLLDSAIEISNAFIDAATTTTPKMIVYTKGRLAGSKFTAFANPGDILQKAPLIVLINNGSASASEIVAGALKDNQRAIILGTQSFGKGSVQTILPLDNKHGIKLTTALYYTPSGTSIQAKGITPDIIIEELKIDNKPTKLSFADFNENNLNKHLLGSKVVTDTSKNIIKDDKSLLHKDYQLYAALTILKGLVVANR